MRKRQKSRKHQKILMAAVFLLVLTIIPSQTVRADSGTVYTCSVTASYSNPVTGEIEDAAGEAGYATGQGMVQSAVYSTGILEVTDSGEYYLTVRFGMMDYTSGHSFWVQNVGDSDWSAPEVGQTGSGSDGNGTTADICIQVPSENCLVRVSMYVEPMGRDVIYYFYPRGYSEGNTTDITATMVMAASASSYGGNAALDSTSSEETTKQSSSEEIKKSSDLQSSITEPAAPSTADTSASDVKGLSLSTEVQGEDVSKENSSLSTAGTIFGTAAAVTISGLILMGAAAGILYLFRKNWYRWGGGEDDDA